MLTVRTEFAGQRMEEAWPPAELEWFLAKREGRLILEREEEEVLADELKEEEELVEEEREFFLMRPKGEEEDIFAP